jgi:hypothetical protein
MKQWSETQTNKGWPDYIFRWVTIAANRYPDYRAMYRKSSPYALFAPSILKGASAADGGSL